MNEILKEVLGDIGFGFSASEAKELKKLGVKVRWLGNQMGGDWVEGEFKCLKFQAQIFSENSKYGINRGRTSRLFITDGSDILANFDRGWDIKPKDALAKELTQLLSLKNAKVGNLEVPDDIEHASTESLLAIFKPLKKRYYQYHVENAREVYLRVVAELQKRGKVASFPLSKL